MLLLSKRDIKEQKGYNYELRFVKSVFFTQDFVKIFLSSGKYLNVGSGMVRYGVGRSSENS